MGAGSFTIGIGQYQRLPDNGDICDSAVGIVRALITTETAYLHELQVLLYSIPPKSEGRDRKGAEITYWFPEQTLYRKKHVSNCL